MGNEPVLDRLVVLVYISDKYLQVLALVLQPFLLLLMVVLVGARRFALLELLLEFLHVLAQVLQVPLAC